MIGSKIPYVVYLTLLFGPASYAAPLTSVSFPHARLPDIFANSSTYELRAKISHQRSAKGLVPIYKTSQHGRTLELMLQKPDYVEQGTQFHIESDNVAKNFDGAGASAEDVEAASPTGGKLSRRSLTAEARDAFRRILRQFYNPTTATLSSVGDSTPLSNIPAPSSSIESSMEFSPSSSVDSSTEISTTTTAPTASSTSKPSTQTTVQASDLLGILAASITATTGSETAEMASTSITSKATQTTDSSIVSTSAASASVVTDETITSSTATDHTSTKSSAKTTSSAEDSTVSPTSTPADNSATTSTDTTVTKTTSTDIAVTTTTSTDTAVSPTGTPKDQLQYWGGSMLVDPINIYHIYYGNWTDTQREIIDDFINNLPLTSYWNTILPTYKDNQGREATTDATLMRSIVQPYSHGTVLDDRSVEAVISEVILSGRLGAPDPNGVYMIMTDKTVQQTSGFCTTYCGYHDFFDVQGVKIKYGFMGDPTNCIVGCSPANPVNSPNNDPGVDSVVSILLHELIEIITDPIPPTGWIDGFGNENGDLCAYQYGAVKRLPNGAFYNQQLGGRNYLVQLMWAMDVNGCRA